MLQKPLPAPGRPDLASFEKKAPLYVVKPARVDVLGSRILSSDKRTELIQLLQTQMYPLFTLDTLPFEPDPVEPLVLPGITSSNSGKVESDDESLLDDWLASYTPLVKWEDGNDPSNRNCSPLYYALEEREWRKARHEASEKVRKHKGNKHSNLLDQVFVSSNPTKGWWRERPPTLDQLFSTTKQQAENYYHAGIVRRERIQELKHALYIRRVSKGQTKYDDMFMNSEPANDIPGFSPAEIWEYRRVQDERYELRRLDASLCKYRPDRGLAKFFYETGVPTNADYSYRQYWVLQELAAWEYTPEQLYIQYRDKYDAYLYDQHWTEKSDEDRLQQWFASHQCDYFIPEGRMHKPKNLFERKLSAYAMCVEKTDMEDQASVNRTHAVRRQLFTAKGSNYRNYTNRVHPMVPVGKPYGEFDRRVKKQLVRESNLKHVAKHINAGKTWPYLGLSNRQKEQVSEQDKALALRITDRIFSVEEVKDLIREEIPRIRDSIKEEMMDYTVALVSEFEVAMEDCVERVVENAAKAVRRSSQVRRSNPSPLGQPLGGFSPNSSGIFVPEISSRRQAPLG